MKILDIMKLSGRSRQRNEQLLRIPPQAVDLAGNQITFIDPKSRRQIPRKHILPIPENVKPLFEKLKLSKIAYCLGDIRRAVETILAH